MVSFIAVSWITIIVAMVPAYDELIHGEDGLSFWYNLLRCRRSLHKSRSNQEELPGSETTQRKRPEFPVLLEAAKLLLGILCDLQVITGTAIVMAGFSQIHSISFYHEQLVITYWWMTLNSFWACRPEYMDENTKMDSVRITVRRAITLVSVMLGLAFQGYINHRERNANWDDEVPGRCYNFSDGTSSWPWVVGGALYAIALLLVISPITRPGVLWYHNKSIELQRWLYERCGKECFFFMMTWSLREFIMLVLTIFGFAFWWGLRVFLSVWSYGDSDYPFFLLFYVGFGVWNTYDALSLRALNRHLIDGDETKWGFGQVLPVVLMAAILVNGVDIYRGEQTVLFCPFFGFITS
jgi:hypothetical protein